MKVQELLQEKLDSFGDIKELNNEFKEIGRKFSLTLVAGMGWPRVNRAEAWFGGGLGERGNGKLKDVALLSLEKRRLGFLKALAKKLEELKAEGFVIKIGVGVTSKGATVIKDENIFDVLSANIRTERPPGNVRYSDIVPCIVWSVGAAPGSGDFKRFLSFSGWLLAPMENNNQYANMYHFRTITEVTVEQQDIFKKVRGLVHKYGRDFKRTSGAKRVQPDRVVDAAIEIAELGYLKKTGVTNAPYDRKNIIQVAIDTNITSVSSATSESQPVPFEKIEAILKKHGFVK